MKRRLASLVCVLVFLSGCGEVPQADASPEGTGEELTALTQEEVDRVNEAYASTREQDGVVYSTPVSGFFTSRYEAAEELDFEQFLAYFPSDGILEDGDAAEFAALTKLSNFPFHAADFDQKELRAEDLPVPTHRIFRASVDDCLSRYAGITTAELKNGTGVLYLEKYDVYYTFTSDFGPGEFHCVGGETNGDTARLWTAPREDGSQTVLTLRKEGDNWLIQSFVDSGADPRQTLKGVLSNLTAEEIGYVSSGERSSLITAETLAPMIREAVKNPVDHENLTLNGSDTDAVWGLEFYLGDKDAGSWSGEDGVSLWAGLEENLVEISAGANLPRGRLWVEDKALYQLLRTQSDTPDHIDRAAYETYKDTVDAYFGGRRAEAWDGGFSAWELTDFFLELENQEQNVRLYRMAAAYRTAPPEKAVHMLAGGMYVDSALRAHGLDWQPVRLLAVDGKAVSVTGDGRAEEADLNGDGEAEIVAYLPGNVRGVVIYDLADGRLTGLDVNQTLGCRSSDYTGNISNIQGEYSDCVEAFFGENGVGVSKIYRYTADRTLEYVCGLDEALRR